MKIQLVSPVVLLASSIMVTMVSFAPSAQAGLFNTVRFTPAGQYELGIEPELQLSDGSGVGANIRFNQGLTDLNNLNLLIGTGGGSRGFRFGGNFTFDFFPDIAGQPGIGLAVQGIYYRVGVAGTSSVGQLDLAGIPYIHKAIALQGKDEIEPYFAVPLGAAFSGGQYSGTSSIVVGALFKNVDRFRYNLELGIGLSSQPTYVSGGIIIALQ